VVVGQFEPFGQFGVFEAVGGRIEGLVGDLVADPVAAFVVHGFCLGFVASTGLFWLAHWPLLQSTRIAPLL